MLPRHPSPLCPQADVEYGNLDKHTIIEWPDETNLDLEGHDREDGAFVNRGLTLCFEVPSSLPLASASFGFAVAGTKFVSLRSLDHSLCSLWALGRTGLLWAVLAERAKWQLLSKSFQRIASKRHV